MNPIENTGRPLVRFLAVGLLAWLIFTTSAVVWFFVSEPDPGLAGVAFPFYAWFIGYFPAGALLLIYGTILRVRQKLSTGVLIWAISIYFIPVLFQLVFYKIFLSFQPLAIQQGDEPAMTVAFSGPSFFFLYFVGLVIGFALRDKPFKKTVVAILAPPVTGMVFAIAGLFIMTFSSAHWKHRKDFELSSASFNWRDPRGLTVYLTLKSQENLTGVLHAYYQDEEGKSRRSEPIDSLQIDSKIFANSSWTETPIPFKTGEIRHLRFVWRNLRTTSTKQNREVVLRITGGPNYFAGPLLMESRIPADPDNQFLSIVESRLESFTRNGLMGYRNKAGKTIIEPQFDWADEFSEGRALVRLDGRFGFIDTTGRVVIDVTYDNATKFSDGLAGATLGQSAGFIDRSGKTAIPFRFEAAHVFSDGRARVRTAGKDGFINRNGSFSIAPQWTWAEDFSDGIAAVRVGEKWGFIDTSGNWVAQPKFVSFRRFQDGYADVMIGNEWLYLDKKGRLTKQKN